MQRAQLDINEFNDLINDKLRAHKAYPDTTDDAQVTGGDTSPKEQASPRTPSEPADDGLDQLDLRPLLPLDDVEIASLTDAPTITQLDIDPGKEGWQWILLGFERYDKNYRDLGTIMKTLLRHEKLHRAKDGFLDIAQCLIITRNRLRTGHKYKGIRKWPEDVLPRNAVDLINFIEMSTKRI